MNDGDHDEILLVSESEEQLETNLCFYEAEIIEKAEIIAHEHDIANIELDEGISCSVTNDNDDNDALVSVELSKEDQDDAKAVVAMFGDDETEREPCCLNNCNSKIPKELAVQHRYTFLELDKKEKELVILGHLQQHRRISPLIEVYARKTIGKRRKLKKEHTLSRQTINYYFCDLKICKKMYFFLHDLGKKEFDNLVKHFDENGLTPRVHKSKFQKANRDNVITTDDIESIVAFIKAFGDEFGQQMTRRTAKIRPPQFKNHTVIGLPPYVSKSSLYMKFREMGGKQIARTSFLKVWNTYCPYIISLHRQASTSPKHNDFSLSDEEFQHASTSRGSFR